MNIGFSNLDDRSMLSDSLFSLKGIAKYYDDAILEMATPDVRRDLIAIHDQERDAAYRVWQEMNRHGWYSVTYSGESKLGKLESTVQQTSQGLTPGAAWAAPSGPGTTGMGQAGGAGFYPGVSGATGGFGTAGNIRAGAGIGGGYGGPGGMGPGGGFGPAGYGGYPGAPFRQNVPWGTSGNVGPSPGPRGPARGYPSTGYAPGQAGGPTGGGLSFPASGPSGGATTGFGGAGGYQATGQATGRGQTAGRGQGQSWSGPGGGRPRGGYGAGGPRGNVTEERRL